MHRADAIPFLQSDAQNVGAAAIETFAFLGLAWSLVYVIIWIARWVRNGFKQSASQP
jgi:hypothetical protein